MDTARHVFMTGPVSRSLRRLPVVAVAASLLSMHAAGSADAGSPSETLPPPCTPLVCAANYIGVTPSHLAAILTLRNQGGEPAGINLTLVLLDEAQQTKLVATECAIGPTPVVRHAIVAAHDHARDGLAVYAVTGVLPLMTP